ncbi:vWA domain-containing protein [Limosilactobacillus sp.]|jgi:predicted metal-dependent peptidase|uniref:vWA domain-containing protein n=1 Tax=Limosilactobacillus sp. TaxID=2773925 RepID=UPI0025C30602|nr:VWA-like domain-containing protein [Limosilactobacillus sp.]MCH3921529.1 VWA-like domain-containing protein [Limosilactobacillus sp.]MCH3928300.1 VWA-like domain-containing protein [Limosilactobacillus sp.]
MSFLDRLFHHQKRQDTTAADQATRAVVQLLQSHRFLGEVLLQLPRSYDPDQAATAELAWQGDQLILRINPDQFLQLRTDDQQTLLAHEALHVLWQHPLRYAQHPHPDMVKVATDVAVNQYLAAAPTSTATLAQLRRLLRKRVPARLDSQEYLILLENTTVEEQERLKKGGLRLSGQGHGQQSALGTDGHQGWRTSVGQASQGSQQIRLANLRRVLRHAWQQTPKRDRGLLPGEVVQQLTGPRQSAAFDWQSVLRHQVGKITRGKEKSRARFNRRQPLRMDLPGQVSHQTADLRIFVDNSGSMTDAEIRRALAEIRNLVARERPMVTVYSFDAKVYGPGQRLRSGHQIEWQRQGGGGTSFQAIFDYLRDHHVSRTGAVIVIITDGWGEEKLRMHRYRNVDWLLTTTSGQLSVKQPRGHVFQLKEGIRDDKHFESTGDAAGPDPQR